MENKNNPSWDVKFNYIDKDDLKTLYGFVPDKDQTTDDENKTDLSVMAIAIGSERVNTIAGNKIESIGFDNFNETQKKLIKRATARLTIYYLTDGMSYLRASVSMSGNGLSTSISPPTEPDYVLNEVYNLLQQANVHNPLRSTSTEYCKPCENFNTPTIYDESDTRTVNWDSGLKTFLQLKSLVAGEGIKLEDVTDTIPKIKITSFGGIDPNNYYTKKETNNNFVSKEDFSNEISKLDKSKQDKLTAGINITIDENNVISAKGGDLSNYYTKTETDNKFQIKQIKTEVNLGSSFVVRTTYQTTTYVLKSNTRYIMEVGLLTNLSNNPTVNNNVVTEVTFFTNDLTIYKQQIIYAGWNKSIIGLGNNNTLICSADDLTSALNYPCINKLYEVKDA